MPETQAADHPAVAAVLAVTPLFDGLAITGTTMIDPGTHYEPDGEPGPYEPPYEQPVFGFPRPIAARQAAAVLRWAADKLAAESEEHQARTGNHLFPLADWRVRGFAAEIDGGTDER